MLEKYEWQIFSLSLLIGLGLHLYCTWGGLIWNSDSFHYWAASRSFKSEGVLQGLDGGPLTFWSPLYPIILSLFSEKVYHIFHSLCFITSLLFIYLYLKTITKQYLALISVAIFILSVYPYITSSFLWSETIFILLLFSGLLSYNSWLQNKRKNNYLIISILLLSLLCLQRNAGVFIIVGLSITALLNFIKTRNWKLLLKLAVVHVLIVAPNILWNSYQKITIPQEFNFSDRPFAIDFFSNLETISIELTRFFIPIKENSNSVLILILGLILLTIIILQKSKRLPITVLYSYIILFLLMPKFELSETGRFLTPVFPIIILLLVLQSKEALSKFKSQKIKMIFSVFLALIIFYNIGRTTKNVSQWNYRSIHHPKSAKIFF